MQHLLIWLVIIFSAICVRLGTSNLPPSLSKCTSMNVSYATLSNDKCINSILFLKEEAPIGTSILEIQATDPDTTDSVVISLKGDSAALKFFKITTDPTNRKAFLSIDSRIDVEQLGDSRLLAMQLSMDDGQGNSDIRGTITVIINDINDNSPEFISQPYRWDIPEITVGAKFTFQVVDKDTSASSIGDMNITISGVSGIAIDGIFRITNTTFRKLTNSDPVTLGQTGGVWTVVVSLLKPLDYEVTRFYQISVRATDTKSDGLTALTDIIINVIDLQDTPPFFEGIPYLKTIAENTEPNTNVIQVIAKDGDRGNPNVISYSMDTINNFTKLFKIDNTTGWITTSDVNIDRESAAIQSVFGTFDLPVNVKEVSSTVQQANISQSQTTVRITVVDQNDFKPTFSSSSFTASVVENSQVGIPISISPIATVSDLDSGVNGQFKIYLTNLDGSPFDMLEVSPSVAVREATLIIRVKNNTLLDYEKLKFVLFKIAVEETGTSQKYNSTAIVNLTVIDANDNRPQFAQSKYVFNLTENTNKGTLVGEITASDDDSGTFGQLTYKLEGTDAAKFFVNSTTGQIYVNVDADKDHNLLDRERFSNLYLTFQATDGGGFISTVQLELQLQDENDQVPTFSRTKYSTVIAENAVVFESPVQVEATDNDIAPNNVISYSIVAGDPSNYFNITTDTGIIGLTRAIDYEGITNKEFLLSVMASDGGTPSLNSTVTVSIRVEDRNDMSPKCSQSVYNSSVQENATSGFVIVQVNATDGDAPGTSNSEVFMRIQTGAADKFTMNGDSGIISVERGADLDVNKYGKLYNLTIAVFDKGSPQLSGSCHVQVHVLDVNNQAPYFDPLIRRELVQENVPINSALPLSTPYVAKDPDFSANLQYKILYNAMSAKQGNGQPVSASDYNYTAVFEIDLKNGTIYVRSTLDREKAEEITIPIEVHDLSAQTALPIQTATGTLVLTISDLNDETPVFSAPAVNNTYRVNLSESLSVPIDISLKAVATDADKSTVEILYDISPPSTLFKINSKSAQVSLVSALDREKVDNHMFYITANDSVHVTTATVYVTVIDSNDESPYFVQFSESLFVLESDPVGKVVSTVKASDNDTGNFGVVNYRILSGSGGRFDINQTTGEVYIKEALNRDLPGGDSYTLLIEAYDNPGQSDSRSSKKQMAITIIDVNDEKPTFAKNNYTITSLLESMSANQRIDTIPATDADAGDNSVIVFSLAGMPGQSDKGLTYFTVNSLSGPTGYSAEIRTKISLKNAVGWYNLTLIATDQGTPAQTGSTYVTLFIADVNDFAPKFVFPNVTEYSITVNESTNASSTVGKQLLQASAVDDDFDLNGVVRYKLDSSSGDHNSFSINNVTGVVTILTALDRETKAQYRFQLTAYDMGTERSLSSSINIIVNIWDVDEHPPSFPNAYRTQSLTFPENVQPNVAIPGLINATGGYVGNVAKAIDLDVNNNLVVTKMCYFMISKSYDMFYLNKTTGDLYVLKSLDRESVAQYEVIIQAVSETYCTGTRYEWRDSPHIRVKRYLDDLPVTYNPNDASMSKIVIQVQDKNDNSPKWTSDKFFGGVTVNDPPGTTVFRFGDYASDADAGNNSALTYKMYQLDASLALKVKLQERKIYDIIFNLDTKTGLLKTGERTYFQEDMSGSISFLINATDGTSSVTANCTIYVLSLDQQVVAVFRDNSANITKIRDRFAEYLSNITGWRVVVDNIVTHKNEDGSADSRQTDMYLHAINKDDNSIIPAIEFRDKLDLLWVYLKTLYNEYHVTEVKLAKQTVQPNTDLEMMRIALIAVACGLTILLCAACVSLWSCRRMYRRKLKAATAVAFGPGGQLNHLRMPGTNMHTYEGSNPIWLETYDPSHPHNNLAYDSDRDSIDNNVIDEKMKGQIGEVEKTMTFLNDVNSETGSIDKGIYKDKFGDDTAMLNAAIETLNHSSSTNGTVNRNGMVQSNGGVTANTLEHMPFTNI